MTGSNEQIQSNIGRLILSLKVSTRNHCVNKNLIEHSVASYIRKEPGREDIHIYVQVNQVAVDPKGKKKNPTTLSFNYMCQFKLGNKSIKKESERLTLLPSGHGDLDGVTSLKPELVLVP